MKTKPRANPRRLLSLLLAWLLCLSCAQPALAANETAKTVQLMKTEGTVSVAKSDEKKVSLRDKMRLYNGYHVETEEASYAWLSLDSSKLSKLDAASELELRKNGKKLELLLNAGNLFFNVTEPLETEETLNIRTSTMVVGIRGTCGWVRVIDRWNTEVYLLEGQVECHVSDPVTGEIKSAVLTGGEMADFVVYPQDRDGDKCGIIKDRFTEGDIPGFVLAELVKDVDLCDQIYRDSGLDILGHLAQTGGGDPSGKLPSGDAATPEAAAEADRKLKEDEAETARKLEDIRQQEAGQEHNISKDPVWKDEKDTPAAGGGTSGGSPVTPTQPVTPPAAAERTMKITDDEAQEMLAGASTVRVLPDPDPADAVDNLLEVDSGLTVPAGKILALRPGINVAVYDEQPLRVDGTLNVEGGNLTNRYGNLTVTSSNTLYVVGNLTNLGRMGVTASGRVMVDGTFTNAGELTPVLGAAVKAKAFDLQRAVDGWVVSETADAAGYYTLVKAEAPDPGPGPNPDPGPDPDPDPGDMTWEYDAATQTLRISGSGDMPDYSLVPATNAPPATSTAPWSEYTDEVKAVEILGMTSIGDYAFYKFANMETVSIPDGVTSIKYGAFQYCNNLTGVTIPDSVNTIGSFAFGYCSSLTDITIPDGVTSIGSYAFAGCSSLTSIVIPDGVTSIENGIFDGCSSLTTFNIPDGVLRIGSLAFRDCRMTSIRIPDSVTSIGNCAFESCSALTSITIPEGVTSIEDMTFRVCSSLTSVTLPNSITTIGDDAFNGTALTDVYYRGTEEQWNAITIATNNDPLINAAKHYNATRAITSKAPAPGYADVDPDAWYADAAAYCRDTGIMGGVTENTFDPEGVMTRAMLVTVLYRAAGSPEAAGTAAFPDVEEGSWYADAVRWAAGQGVVDGYGSGLFGTEDPVTREQTAAILWRFAGSPTVDRGEAFADASEISSYAANAVNWARTAGIISGVGGNWFDPHGSATRAQAAVILMNYLRGRGLTEVSAMDVMCEPSGIALLPDRSLLVTDTYNKVVWRVANGVSEIYAGSSTVEDLYGRPLGGYNDALLADSYFKTPWAVAPFLDGWAVSDTENGAVRLITSSVTQTVNGGTKENLKVGDLGVAFDYPTGLAADESGNLYVSDTRQDAIRKITPEGEVTTFAKGLSSPMGLCWKDGALYAAEAGANRIVKIVDGAVTVLAGSGEDGLADGPAASAAFSGPKGVAVGADGAVYVADTANSAVRQIKDGQVTTLAVRDVTDLDAFSPISPVGMLVRGSTLYICDQFSRKLLALPLN